MTGNQHGTARSNKNLKSFYENSYIQGEENVFTFFDKEGKTSDDVTAVYNILRHESGSLLDIGCGTGLLLHKLALSGRWSSLVGIDYATSAIQRAQERLDGVKPSVSLIAADVLTHEFRDRFDVITCLGTLEHIDHPQEVLIRVQALLKAEGFCLVVVPHFINFRGFVWMTLQHLFDVPMSLSDIHFINPWHMTEWCRNSNLKSELVCTIDNGKANGVELTKDFSRRIPNALRDAHMSRTNVDRFMDYVQTVTMYVEKSDEITMHGATAIYKVTHKSGVELA